MSYIEFDKTQLINLEYVLSREILRTNRAGSFACTTIIGCNTRKYHGLLICPMDEFDGGFHVLLSGLDETIIQHDKEFNLAVRKYPGVYEPRGHKYIREYDINAIPALIYRVGGVVLKKEMLLAQEEERILIRYTLLEAHSPTILRLRPFLAFRNIHALSKANMDADFKYYSIKNGIKLKLYTGYKYLFLQISKQNEYIPVPNWYYNVEYIEEQKRGYEFHEDLYVPGYFELSLKKDESIVFTAGLEETTTQRLSLKFDSEVLRRIPRNDYENCLINSAQQFIVRKNKRTEIIAGFPWFGRWARDTFISLPGLTLSIDDGKTCKAVLDTMSNDLKDGLFPNLGKGSHPDYQSVDAPLWYIWAIQQYYIYSGKDSTIWRQYSSKMRKILGAYRAGTSYNIHMMDNGLIYAGFPGIALTWMDAVVHGKPVTPRTGCAVEINALWYNAIMFSLHIAKKVNDTSFINEWKELPEKIAKSFNETFWDEKKGYLADYVEGEFKDWSVRPNMLFAASLHYSPVSDEKKQSILEVVRKELLTSKGIRSLSPKNPDYKGICEGDQISRDLAYHQGTVWPWLLGHFVEAYFKIHGKSAIPFIEKIYYSFEEDMTLHGIGTISEIFDGDPPHRAGGAISQAWNIAELLRINKLIDYYKKLH
ncbi:MAG: glycogen debranching enzyme family protein [Bacteroidia bacterium]|nr:glycogen debranching enzyme family protein [Bacteroidia bacterium]